MLKIKAQKAYERSEPGAKESGGHQVYLLTDAIENAVGFLNHIIDAAERGTLDAAHTASLVNKVKAELQNALNDKSLSDAGFAGRSRLPTSKFDVLNVPTTPHVPTRDSFEEIENMRTL
jgi:hypothetical protein